MLSWFLRYLRARRKRRYLKWVNENKVVYLAKPSPDERNWIDAFRRNLK